MVIYLYHNGIDFYVTKRILNECIHCVYFHEDSIKYAPFSNNYSNCIKIKIHS